MTDSRAVFGIYERGEGGAEYVDVSAYLDASIDEKGKVGKRSGEGGYVQPGKGLFRTICPGARGHARICQMYRPKKIIKILKIQAQYHTKYHCLHRTIFLKNEI